MMGIFFSNLLECGVKMNKLLLRIHEFSIKIPKINCIHTRPGCSCLKMAHVNRWGNVTAEKKKKGESHKLGIANSHCF